MSDQTTWTLNDLALESNPDNLRVSPIRWVRHYPKWPLIWAGSFLLVAGLAHLVHWSLAIPAVVLLLINWFYWKRVRDHFRFGYADPAIIVAMDPMLIAVGTDLTLGVGHYPVIKIIEKSLSTAGGKTPRLGSMFAAVSLYSPSPNQDLPHWADFDPRPIDCATTDEVVIKEVMGAFPNEDWRELKSWLRQVPRPFRVGVYKIRLN